MTTDRDDNLAGMSDLLDALARAERDSAPESLEAALMSATTRWVGAQGLGPVSAGLDRLAAAEHHGAPLGLEDRLLAASRGALGGAPARIHEPALRLAGGPAAPVHGRRFRFSPAWRIAASLLIVASGGAVWLAMRPPAPIPQGGDTNAVLTERLDAGLDDLFDVIDSAYAPADTVAEYDYSQIQELLDPESLS